MMLRLHALIPATFTLLALACSTTAGQTVYRVRVEAGDTLAGIAVKYDTSWDKIAKLNGIAPGTGVRPGTILRIAPGPGGRVAGAPAPRAARPPSKEKHEAPASPDEFTEADFPTDGAAGAGGGMLFGGRRASLTWPLTGELSSRFGMRDGKLHQGLDIRAPRGTPVRAAGRGKVEFAGRQNGYGRTVIVNHGAHKTLYAHLTKIRVRRGERVDPETVVGTVGTSGNASGPHLHFEVRSREDKPLDPLRLLEEDRLLSARR